MNRRGAEGRDSIAACLIVKDAIDTIGMCVQSIRPFVDEINIFDTGSSDGTLEFLSRAAATGRAGDASIRIARGEWRDDFAWARQQSFELASPEAAWLYWLDADDEVIGAGELRRLARDAPPDVDGFLVHYDYARDAEGNVTVQRWRERLVRRASAFYWSGTVHEVLVTPQSHPEPVLVRVPGERLRHIHRPSKTRWEPSRNLAILRAEEQRCVAEGREPDGRTLYYLGEELAWRGDFTAAEEYFRAYVQRFGVDDWADPRTHAVHRLAACLRHSHRAEAALELERAALVQRPDSAELRFGVIESAAALGRWADVERFAQLSPFWDSISIASHLQKVRLLPLLRLAEAKVQAGSYAAAAAVIRDAVEAAGGSARLAAAATAVADHLAAGDPASARAALHEAAAAYDSDLDAVVRGLRLAAEEHLKTVVPDPRWQ